MQDEYVSVEHILLGIINNPNAKIGSILRNNSISKQSILSALKDVRGNTRVTSENPEETYDVLNKYGQDSVSYTHLTLPTS